MKILALEFSSEQRSVAIAVDGVVRASASQTTPRVTTAFELIEKVLVEAKIEREEIECIAVGLGPGSFTGIRSAVALAQGWQLALGIKLIGVPSVEVMAADAQARKWFGNVNFAIDAQRNELYLAQYEITLERVSEKTPLKLVSVEDVGKILSEQIIAGPEGTRWFAQGRIIFPEAATLAKIASTRTDFQSGDKLEPIYLRETNFVKAPPPRIVSDK